MCGRVVVNTEKNKALHHYKQALLWTYQDKTKEELIKELQGLQQEHNELKVSYEAVSLSANRQKCV